jgi:hypothetical protein
VKSEYSIHEEYKIYWPIYRCKIKDGKKIVRVDNTDAKFYNPFTLYEANGSDSSLHMEFAAIDTEKPDKILEFINKYGFLGLSLRNRNDKIEFLLAKLLLEAERYNYCEDPSSYNFDNLSEVVKESKRLVIDSLKADYDQYPSEELLCDISYEIVKFKNLLTLIEKKDTASFEELYELIFNISTDVIRPNYEMDMKDTNNITQLRLRANIRIIDKINYELKDVNPLITYKQLADNKFDIGWKTTNLISSLYVMLYTDLTLGKKIMKCRNVNCGLFFHIYGNDNRKIYCSNLCGRAVASRKNRRKKKEKGE